MKAEDYKNSDLANMTVESVMRTVFHPASKDMKFISQVVINGEVIEQNEYFVAHELKNKNDLFISISNKLADYTAGLLRSIYNRK